MIHFCQNNSLKLEQNKIYNENAIANFCVYYILIALMYNINSLYKLSGALNIMILNKNRIFNERCMLLFVSDIKSI